MRRFALSRSPEADGGEILIESGLLLRAGGLFCRALPGARRVLLVTDENVAPLYAQGIFDSLRSAGCRVRVVVLAAGERSRTPDTVGYLWGEMQDLEISRTDGVLALGGGSVADAAGFAAVTYAGGVSWVLTPTSLTAQVNAAPEGAAALDLPGGKDLVSVPSLPALVLVDPDVLMSLPDRDFSSGMASMIGLAAAADAALFGRVLSCRGRPALMGEIDELLRACCDLRSALLADPRPDRRELLRYGALFGRAAQRACRNGDLLYGEALAAGICQANAVGELLGVTPPRVSAAVRGLLARFSLPAEAPVSPARYRDRLLEDLRREGERVSAVLLTETGAGKSRSFTPEELISLCCGN